MSEVHVRPGKSTDAVVVSTLLRSTWAETYANVSTQHMLDEIAVKWHNVDVIERQIADPTSCFLVAEISQHNGQSEIVGHALARLKPGYVIWLSKLYILPSGQNKGTGKALLTAVLENFPDAHSISLEVGSENHQAIGFYKHLGFHQTGQAECCGGRFDIPALVMEKDLKNG